MVMVMVRVRMRIRVTAMVKITVKVSYMHGQVQRLYRVRVYAGSESG
jgi:hypothetical protein